MFLPHEEKDVVINNIYRWDQAFRIYASIYSEVNPTRSAEIWQYVESIHDAARSYPWENVANYDYMFRQLMDQNPGRSWAKQFTQMWNRTMCEGLYKNYGHNSKGNSSGGSSSGKSKKDTYCWKFNKSKCNYGIHCNFEHKCSYCYSPGHGVKSCPKKAAQANQTQSEQPKKKTQNKSESSTTST